MTFFSDLKRQIFSRPYPMLPALIFVYFVCCFTLHPQSPFFTHHLSDPDDYMRINEVVSWLQGQGWKDVSVPRMSPGGHTVVHWARLIDLPIACVALPFTFLLDIPNAVFVASLIVPLLWFTALLTLLWALAEQFIGRENAALISAMVLFAPMLLFNYTPGRVDHHGAQALIAGFGLLSLCHIIRGQKGNLFSILSALGFACGFWIGAEALPWAIIFISLLAIMAILRGGQIQRDAALFGLALTGFTAILVPLVLPSSAYSSLALSWFSPAYVVFSVLSGSIFILGWVLQDFFPTKGKRLLVYGLAGMSAAFAFFLLIPDARHGPFKDYDAFDATIALDNITEAQPLVHAFRMAHFITLALQPMLITFARLLALPLTACGVCLWQILYTKKDLRALWMAQGVFLICATALTLFWQLRVGIYMELFSLVPLTTLLTAWWAKLKGGLTDRPLFWSEIAVFLLLGLIPVVIVPATFSHSPLYPNIALFPADRTLGSCALDPVLPFLNDPNGLGAKPLTLMNSSDMGPELLFSTRHNVVAGNFDVPGNSDAFAFFNATDETVARKALQKWGVDVVIFCRNVPMMYLSKDYYDPKHMQLVPNKNGDLEWINTEPVQPLIQRLIRGDIPPWLKTIEIPDHNDYLLFKVQDLTGT